MITLSRAEGEALRALDALLGGELGGVRAPVPLSARSARVLGVGATRMARAAVRWLVHGGGWRARTVLRAGRRARGRAWDAGLNDGFTLAFSDVSLELWTWSMDLLPSLRAEEDPDARRALRARMRVRRSAAGSGDHIIAALAVASSPGLTTADERAWASALREISPVAALLRPEAPLGEAARASLDALLAGPSVRVIECAQDRFCEGWIAALARSLDPRGLAPAARTWAAVAAVLRAWCEGCERVRRADLLAPAARTVSWLVDALGEPEAARARAIARVETRSIAERDARLASLGSVLEVGSWLLRRRGELSQERWGDERYEEAQVFFAHVDTALAPRRAALHALANALSQRVG